MGPVPQLPAKGYLVIYFVCFVMYSVFILFHFNQMVIIQGEAFTPRFSLSLNSFVFDGTDKSLLGKTLGRNRVHGKRGERNSSWSEIIKVSFYKGDDKCSRPFCNIHNQETELAWG